MLSYGGITDGDANYLHDFLISVKGQLTKFTFTHPETAVEYTVRFDDDTLMREEIGSNLFNVTIGLIEVL